MGVGSPVCDCEDAAALSTGGGGEASRAPGTHVARAAFERHYPRREPVSDAATRPTAYLKRACPFCLKFRIALTELGQADAVDYVTFDDGNETHQAMRAKMEAAGQQPSFPAVDFGDGTLVTGTDDLIARFAREAGRAPADLPLLRYYEEGVFPAYGRMFRELRELKSASGG